MSEREALQRIVALLLGLADVAERASRRLLPIRLLALWILRPAEACARNMVMRAAYDLGAQANLPPSFVENIAPMILGQGGQRATDVLRLALAFRMLADLLQSLAALASSRRPTLGLAGLLTMLRAGLPPVQRWVLPTANAAVFTPACYDTS